MINAFSIDAWELYDSLEDGRIDNLMQIIKENNKETIYRVEKPNDSYFEFLFPTAQDRNKAFNEVSKIYKTAKFMTRFRRKRNEG